MKMSCAKCGANVRFKRRALKISVEDGQVFFACPGACTAAVEALIAETPSTDQVIDHRKN